MKTTILALLVSLVLFVAPASAQTIMKNTTLASAVTSTTANTIVLTTISFTPAIAANDVIWVDAELMRVLVAPTTTTVSVQRGASSTVPTTHPASAIVYTVNPGTFPTAFTTRDPPYASTCVRSQQPILPIVNIQTAVVWTCGYLGQSVTASLNWRATSVIVAFTYNSMPVGHRAEPVDWLAMARPLRDRLTRWLAGAYR